MRLAWFTPWPPQPSGVAGRSAELSAELAARGHAIDVFVDEAHVPVAGAPRVDDDPPAPGAVRLQSAHDAVWRLGRGQYDLAIYQIGNSRWHEFIWPYLFRWPGLVVLHDARLHHARGRALLRHRRFDDYRAELQWNHPGAPEALAEVGVRGFDGAYFYAWPMTRAITASARLVASHSRGACRDLAADSPHRAVEYIALGDGRPDFDVAKARARFRGAHGLDPAAVVFGVCGALTANKRVPQILRAFAATHAHAPDARLVLVGEPDPLLALDATIDALGIRHAVCLIRDADDAAFDDAVAAADISLNLRWPTAIETSGPWVKSLAAGRATVIVDLEHQGHIPVLDPRTWRRHAPCDDGSPDADARAVAVAVDILDEEHSLRLAMRRLSTDTDLRERLGRAARAYWETEHTVARMVDDYERAMTHAVSLPLPDVHLPAHLRPNPAAGASKWLEGFETLPRHTRSLLADADL